MSDQLVRISNLPPSTLDDDLIVLGQENRTSTRVNLREAVQKWATEAVAMAVIKCASCGQWGARFCACRHCGAPIE